MKNPRVKHLWRMSIFAALLLLIALAYGTARLPRVQNDQDEGPDSCTSIMVGRLASTDGSVMTAHTCDGNYRNWLNVVPHQKYDKGANTKVYWGTLHTESAWDLKGKPMPTSIRHILA
jgi:dipeptidase